LFLKKIDHLDTNTRGIGIMIQILQNNIINTRSIGIIIQILQNNIINIDMPNIIESRIVKLSCTTPKKNK